MTLRELRVHHLAVIDELMFVPDERFTVISGETGAGKSLLIEALRIALGERPRQESIRHGEMDARCTAVFDDLPEAVCAVLTSHGIAEESVLTVTRELHRGGKSASRINGALVSSQVVKEVAALLVDVTAQGSSSRLSDPEWQLDLLDASGGEGILGALASYRTAHAAARALSARLAAARKDLAEGSAALSEAEGLIAELAPLTLVSGEKERLESERERIRSAAERSQAVETMLGFLDGDGTGADAIRGAEAASRPVAAVDGAIGEFGIRLRALAEELSDVSREIRRYGEEIDADPRRLEEIEERCDLIAKIERRFGSVDASLEALAAAREKVETGPLTEERAAELESEYRKAFSRLSDAAAALHGARAAAAASLMEKTDDELHALDLPRARFVVPVEEVDADEESVFSAWTENGADRVSFLLSTHAAMEPLPLAEGPSGGELSRLALALRTVVATRRDAPTVVFDEIDTGLGGTTALRVGDALLAMSSTSQVIAITHRAEIASRATTHVRVRKVHAGESTNSEAGAVDGEDRREEIARLMSGTITEAALVRSDELLVEGRAAIRNSGVKG